MNRSQVIPVFSKTVLIAAVLLISTQMVRAQLMKESDMTSNMDYRDLPFQTITGDTATLNTFHGKVILIVNTASKCGFTPQYEGLEAMYMKYKDRGFTIIGFPANDFLGQEPGSNEEIATFCKTEYGVSFPMMAKVHVKGDEQIPLYEYLTEKSPFPGKITWNFNKFLLDRDGNVIARFDTRTKPEDENVVTEVEKALSSGEQKM
ncbi:MAG: glutathione peroxidase [bacterium]